MRHQSRSLSGSQLRGKKAVILPDIQDLPRFAQEMADVIGLEATIKIVEARGGRRLTVPRNTAHGHWLEELIGLDAFGKLVSYYDGEEIEIPRCVTAMSRARALSVLKSGASISEAAEVLGYTMRGVTKLKRKLEYLGRL